jgi:hypothetical protein
LRQAISKAVIAYYQKYVDEQSKVAIKETLLQYDRTLLVADPRRCEPKKCEIPQCAVSTAPTAPALALCNGACTPDAFCCPCTSSVGMWLVRGHFARPVARAQVWWSRRPRSLPEVVPLSSAPHTLLCAWALYCGVSCAAGGM